MLMLAATFVLWQAAAMDGMARCRSLTEGNLGSSVRWHSDGRDTLTISTDFGKAGSITLQCRVPLPANVSELVLELDHAMVDFAGAQSRETGSGLIVKAAGAEWPLLRVAGEDWIETPGRMATIVPEGRHLLVTITAVDNSVRIPMRIDLRGLRLSVPR